jgi:translation initiation factor IF-2
MSKSSTQTENNKSVRQPVVAILGHVDHGKSSLLDYIRKSNVVDGEAGGITQSISAYEAKIGEHKITFLDTPGHEAFQNMRERGVEIADIAVLVVSAEDGVKKQTLEAYKAIADRKIPFIVAINKIDKAGADIEKTKNSLIENGIYLEGMGGDVAFTPISAKIGTGVTDLLESIYLMAEMHEFKWDEGATATGQVLESFVDAKRGISATLVIKEGTLPTSGSILAGVAMSPIRIVEDFMGKAIKSPYAGQPIKVTGFDSVPVAGSIFISSSDKKEIEKVQEEAIYNQKKMILDPKIYRNAKVVVPTVIRADAVGALEAIKYEIKKLETNDMKIKIISEGVGNISEGDILQASGDEKTIILGFNVTLENKAREQAERFNLKPQVFDIIYKLSEWYAEEVEKRMPYEEVEKVIGKLKVIKTFSVNKDLRVIGGKVTEGVMRDGVAVKILRRDFEIGKAKVVGLQSAKFKVKEVQMDTECGVEIESKFEIIPSDVIVAVEIERTKLI